MSAFESPNFEGIDLDQLLALPDPELDDNSKPYLITRRWVREKYAEWGVDDPRWNPRVLGAFPRQLLRGTCISLADVEACIDIEIPLEKSRSISAATLRSSAMTRRSMSAKKAGAWSSSRPTRSRTLTQTAGQIVGPFKELNIISSFALDDGGLGGGVTDRLLEQGHQVPPINFGSVAYRYDEYQDIRTEIWWNMRRMFAERRISIPRNEELDRPARRADVSVQE